MQEFIFFLFSFFFVLMIYELFVVKKAKKSKKKDRKEPIEVLYLVKRYHLDLDKIYYPQLLQIISIVSSFDIAFIVSIIMNLDHYLLEMVIGVFGLVILIVISYHLVYLFYKKKGMIIDE